ncbi:MAG: spo0J [Oscillospiraceae bacterium]|jgi:ParB family chromosome partitioning protein|nr:spo0J [Oscillospiraceae bacterium]
MARKSGLGKGLDALFIDNNTQTSSGAVMMKLTEIEPNKNQPRKDFDETALAQLADSIRQHGVIQPLLVRPKTNGSYQLVAGERRWRASRMAGISEVPVVVREMSDTEMMEIALIENLQREDLNPLEEALGYKELIDKYNMTQDEVAQRVGKSRPAVSNMLRLLNLPESVMPMLKNGDISSGHARALLSLDNEEEIYQLACEIPKKGYSVRDIEKMTQKKEKTQSEKKNTIKDSYYDEMQLALAEHLGKKVKIVVQGSKGTLEIEFYKKEELAEMAEKLTYNK